MMYICVYKKLSNLPGLKAMVQNKKKVLEMYAATKKKRSVFNLGNVDGSLGGKKLENVASMYVRIKTRRSVRVIIMSKADTYYYYFFKKRDGGSIVIYRRNIKNQLTMVCH